MRTKMIYILLWWPSWYLLFFMHGTEGELHWAVTEKVSSYGQSLKLFCSVNNSFNDCCNKSAGWRKESNTIFIDIKEYPNEPNLKYGGTYNESGFELIIRNLSESDVNKTYECIYEFQRSAPQYLLQEDVFKKDDPSTDEETSTTDEETSTTDDPSTDEETSTTDDPSTDEETSTTDEGDNTTIIVAAVIIGLVLLIGISIGIVICYVCRKQQRTKQSDTNNSVHYSAEQQGLLPSTSDLPDPRPDNELSPTWCKCTHCREMPAEVEKVCCDQIPTKCFSIDEDFEVVLDAGEYRGAAGHDNSNSRHAAYSEYTLQHHGHLGSGNRRVIPSCCIWKIRDKYPDRYKQYRGFVENKQHNKTMND